MKKFKKIAKFIILTILIIYVSLTFINQQKTLNQYTKNYEDLTSQIEKQKEYNYINNIRNIICSCNSCFCCAVYKIKK